jgi:hypothetical protein
VSFELLGVESKNAQMITTNFDLRERKDSGGRKERLVWKSLTEIIQTRHPNLS